MTDFEARVIQAYTDGASAYKIASAEKVTPSKVYWVLNKYEVYRRSNKQNSRKYEFDRRFFEKIDTEEKAYWLGFIYADGYLVVSGRGNSPQLGISLARKDREHLKRFKKSIKSEHPIRDYKVSSGYKKGASYSRVVITDLQLVEDLKFKGVKPQKSLVLEFPGQDVVPEYLIHHFVRGYYDGDGGISYDSNSNADQIKICGTEEMLTAILKLLNLELKLYRRWPNSKNSWYISIGGTNRLREVLTWLYKDATVYLERKYERARSYLHSPAL